MHRFRKVTANSASFTVKLPISVTAGGACVSPPSSSAGAVVSGVSPLSSTGAVVSGVSSPSASSLDATVAALPDGIPPGEMNTSMTINAPAAWMLGLYIANAENQQVESASLRGTTQNDIVKEYLSRGTYIFPPEPSRRLIVDMVAWCAQHAPKWNPMNVCSYHLQEAGATPVQEIAYSFATAIAVLDAVRDSGQVPAERFGEVVGRISFFVNAGVRFVEIDVVAQPATGPDLAAALQTGDAASTSPREPVSSGSISPREYAVPRVETTTSLAANPPTR